MSTIPSWQRWPCAPAHMSLVRGEVHIWGATLALPPTSVEDLAAVLTPAEQDHAARFRSAQARQHFVAARAILRLILSRYLGLLPQQLRLRTNPWGKPELEPSPDSSQSTLTFNLSHSEALALYAVTGGQAIGIDLEYQRPLPEAELEQLAARYFAPAEYRTLLSLPQEKRLPAFFHCWTRKEAYVKARGQGLSLPLDAFEVSLTPDAPARLLASHEEPDAPQRWSLLAIEPDPAYSAALAVEGHIEHVTYFRWNDCDLPSLAT
ncbi:MAG: 4'-phosphopantetheinyl transferase superfamily protein [Thermogemmatispora sp.]|uniref:4'-phosphopantetheinyl transferase family protein n=1 Tax=Thermogemmatispora sp. TaxID=1968838 RepID=UPI00261C0AD8|nr:4'-phosphopantetheinyl transferase superfamily protein [Thermogemmatispora sp.]MBX5458511.1 4'-phosphopantetheinyl transferase superfamily protein [Thermogemmatispora sp.]